MAYTYIYKSTIVNKTRREEKHLRVSGPILFVRPTTFTYVVSSDGLFGTDCGGGWVGSGLVWSRLAWSGRIEGGDNERISNRR